MPQTQILNEFERLPLVEQLEVIQSLVRISARRAEEREQRACETEEHKHLTEAANLLLADYQEDKELTCFTALDGEAFHAQR